jgi:hypothetical protein
MGFLKSIRGFLVSIYQRLKEKVTNAYLVLTGKHKIIGDVVIDATTGEIIGHNSLKRIGSAIKNSIVDTLCADIVYPKPSTPKGKVIRILSVLGINGILAAGMILLEGAKFSALLMLKVIVLLYLVLVILKITSYVYSFLDRDKYYYSSVTPLEGEVLAITYDETPASEAEETIATFDNEFFTTEEEEKRFHLELADFIRSKRISPELAYYMFCYEKKAKNSKLDNEMSNFLTVSSNSIDTIKLIGRYPKLSSSIMPNGYFDATCSLSFNRYLLPIMFEPNSGLNLARYTKYFYSLVKL